MTSQILKFVDFTKKKKKSRYAENETLLFFKYALITHQGLLYDKE